MRIRVEVDLFVVVIPQPLQCFLTYASPGRSTSKEPNDGSTLGTTEAGVTTGNDVGRDAALAIGGASRANQTPLPGPEVFDFDGIADREDIRIAGAMWSSTRIPPRLADLDPCRFGQCRIGSYSDRKNDNVCSIGLAGCGLNFDCSAIQLLETRRTIVQHKLHSVFLQMILNDTHIASSRGPKT